ncbi:MAG: hypothetical protein H8E17_04365 [Deltaproteobacteria bacterium]|nr:hypothetical protein [Deltaproteobacteria bacterium]
MEPDLRVKEREMARKNVTRIKPRRVQARVKAAVAAQVKGQVAVRAGAE